MMNLFKVVSCLAGAFLLTTSAVAQIGPAEQLLPDDTIAVFTIPDWTKFSAHYKESAWGQLWADPAMKAFRENFSSNLQANFLEPLEKELGIALTNYQELLQGQITLALTPPKDGTDDFVSFLVLIDSREKSGILTAKLAELKKKWTDAGKEVRSERIRDVEFNSITFTRDDVDALLKKAFPPGDESLALSGRTIETALGVSRNEEEGEEPEKIQLRIGQYKSLLIIGENEKTIEKLLARQDGGLVRPLAENAVYQKNHALLFRDSLAHGWVNVKPVFEKLIKLASAEREEEPEPGMPSFSMDKLLPALGINSIQTLGAKMAGNADGTIFEFLMGAPEGQREGLVKILSLEKKDAAPPAFVPADVTKFYRTRIDSQKAWAGLESMISKIDPSLAGFLDLILSTAGKDKDPNFDLKKNLIGNLGDDLIQFEKAPRTLNLEGLPAMPSLTLIGSPNPAQLLDALRMITSLLPPPISSAPLKEREFLGRKIYSMSLAPAPEFEGADGDSAPGATLSFASSGGYVAFSTDDTLLENYLRSGENPPKPLISTAGLAEAARKAGGMGNGFFNYENQAEGVRIFMETLKNDPESGNPSLLALAFGFGQGPDGEVGGGAFERLFDLKLLPSFDRIAKYFGMSVISGATTPEGLLIKNVTPMPAGLRQ